MRRDRRICLIPARSAPVLHPFSSALLRSAALDSLLLLLLPLLPRRFFRLRLPRDFRYPSGRPTLMDSLKTGRAASLVSDRQPLRK